MPENIENKLYSLEAAQAENDLMKQKVESGKTDDYKEAEKLVEEGGTPFSKGLEESGLPKERLKQFVDDPSKVVRHATFDRFKDAFDEQGIEKPTEDDYINAIRLGKKLFEEFKEAMVNRKDKNFFI